MNINIISNKNIIYSCWNKAFFVGMSLFLIGFCWNREIEENNCVGTRIFCSNKTLNYIMLNINCLNAVGNTINAVPT
jgi:hypothetical protein